MSIHDLMLTLFHWPDGIVVGNLLASFLWVPLQWLGMHIRLEAHTAATHKRLDAQDAVLANQDVILTELRDLVAGLKARSDADLLPPDEAS